MAETSQLAGAPGRAAMNPAVSTFAATPAAAGSEAMVQWPPFVTADGRELRVSSTLEPVYEVKAFSRIGFRMIRRVLTRRGGEEEELTSQQVAQLSTAELLRVDLTTIARGIGRLAVDTEQHLSLIVPISYASLSSPKGRGELVEQLKTAGSRVKLGVICEMMDLEGVPAGVLRAAAALVRPITLLVVGRVDATSAKSVLRFEGGGLQAVSLDCPQGLTEPEFHSWATQIMPACKRVAKSALVYGAGSPARAATLASLGATHVSVGAA